MSEYVLAPEAYEEVVDRIRPQGIEEEGVVDQTAYAAMVHDPNTIFVPDGQGQLVPVATPIANLVSYVNADYYRRLPGIGPGPAYYYLHLEHARRENVERYIASLRPAFRALAAAEGQILYDFPLSRRVVDGQVGRLIKEIGGISSRHLIDPRAGHPRHYQYVSPVKFINGSLATGPLRPLDLCTLAEQYPHRKVQVLRTLEKADIDYVWPYYAARHVGELGEHDPIAAGFNEQDFQYICSSPNYTKVVYRDSAGDITNMVVVTAVQNCPWLNRRLLARQFPEEYAAYRVLCGIVAVRKPKSPGGALSLLTLGQVHTLIAKDGQRVIEVGVFDEGSVHTARLLTQLSARGTGITVNFSYPVGHHVFRARQLHAV